MVDRISSGELRSRLAHDRALQVVDVREGVELGGGRIPDALHIPLGELERRAAWLDPHRLTVLVCQSGNRSEEAARILHRRGFSRVYSLDGGMTSFLARGM